MSSLARADGNRGGPSLRRWGAEYGLRMGLLARVMRVTGLHPTFLPLGDLPTRRDRNQALGSGGAGMRSIQNGSLGTTSA